MTSFVFYRVKWSTHPVQAEIWYGDPTSEEIIRQRIDFGTQFNIKIKDERYCIGSETGKGKWITCKSRRLHDGEENVKSALRFKFVDEASEEDKRDKDALILLENKNYTQCYRCSTNDYFSCRMTCMGDYCNPTSERAQILCTPAETSVYLTHVGNELKVGVSLGIPRRWIEQGSDLAAVIATAPGLEARRLEQYVASTLGIKLQVRNTSKIQALNKVNLKKARQDFKDLIKRSKPLIDDILKGVPGFTARIPEIVNLQEHYGDLSFSTPIQEVEALPGNEFGGKIVGLKGSILIVNQGEYHYAMDLKRLMAKEFEFLDRAASIATQSYLDQWF